MKLVIDIQKDVYRVLKEDIYPIPDTERLALVFKTLVKKGTPLPKGHGRLIDADAATKDIDSFQGAFAMYTDNMGKYNIVCTAPTVIKADRDCEHCSRTYGTLGCCSTVSNKWIYSCEEGQREYEETHREAVDDGAAEHI